MAKTGGLGDGFLIGGFDLSGDVGSVDKISGGPKPLDVTGLKVSAFERIGGLRDGEIDFTTHMNPGPAAEHLALSPLPVADTIVTYLRGTATGNPSACLNAKQVNYDPTRGTDGSLSMKVQAMGNAFALEWGKQLTAGVYSASNALAGQNSDFEAGIGNWVLGTNSTIAQSSAQHHGGTKSLAITSAASGDMTALSAAAGSFVTQMFAVTPGAQVNVQAWMRAATSARTCSAGVDWYKSDGTHISTTYGTGVADTTSGFTLVPATLAAPALAAWGAVNLKVAATAAGSEVHYADDVEWFLLPSSLDTGGSLSFGAQAYLQVTAFTGTDATVAIYDSADNVSFAAVTSLAFTQFAAAPAWQRVAISNSATVRRYVEPVVTTSGGFTALSLAVVLVKNPVAGVVF